MNFRTTIKSFSKGAASALLLLLLLSAGCAYVKHVPPGQSLSEALAKKPQWALVAPPPAPPRQPESPEENGPKAVSSELPAPQTEKVADAFTLGNLCLQQGRYADAITAYENALKVDPTFAEAWSKLALAYQDSGQEDKALDAFRRYKMVAVH